MINLMWNIKLIKNRIWSKLWVRKDEFHSSLNLDAESMLYMNEKEREKYTIDLIKRRNIAHKRGLD